MSKEIRNKQQREIVKLYIKTSVRDIPSPMSSLLDALNSESYLFSRFPFPIYTHTETLLPWSIFPVMETSFSKNISPNPDPNNV